MIELLSDVFAVGPFIPHGHCYLWLPELVWLLRYSPMSRPIAGQLKVVAAAIALPCR
jgi:hypothetical protein